MMKILTGMMVLFVVFIMATVSFAANGDDMKVKVGAKLIYERTESSFWSKKTVPCEIEIIKMDEGLMEIKKNNRKRGMIGPLIEYAEGGVVPETSRQQVAKFFPLEVGKKLETKYITMRGNPMDVKIDVLEKKEIIFNNKSLLVFRISIEQTCLGYHGKTELLFSPNLGFFVKDTSLLESRADGVNEYTMQLIRIQ